MQVITDTNLAGVFLVSRAFIPHLKKAKWGRIINMTSVMAHIGALARYICTDATSFMTGTDILMDGGWVAQ